MSKLTYKLFWIQKTYLEDGAELADDVHASHAEVLAERDLQEEERDAAREQGQEVGDQEGP